MTVMELKREDVCEEVMESSASVRRKVVEFGMIV